MTAHYPDNSHDLALLHAIAAGDRDALATLYRGYHRRLGQFLTRLTRRTDLIEEIINDCFWVVWQKAGTFRGDSRVSTWIMGISYRCGLKVLRQSGSLDASDDVDDETAAERGHPGINPGDDRELRDWLAKGLARLSADQRLVLELAYTHGHSIEEIAVITQAPVGTVKARMFHARVKLRNLLPRLAVGSTGTQDIQP
ncbi:sigma-70 family RNA polymerase sigma factor [Acidovorax sp. NCPPB 3859]|nr:MULTISPECIES: sigma-70 family RNA polymerase sigma factor [unclassified Acidovorax]MDA8451743.1 sigma-70 family RNA polymerase sigma factor [Acidovorax sp. GBBC 3297]MDA8461230.1 sigma-70 family RNA polymerase sigma factor [Acidovorax sp. GBBC 3333]MDA8466263.1 sigma-70 family RNA polymerase sigma factor [Acidovorax sp. GBBC 3332]MDA8471257.1 sigma-70 family RNA polymerase sigma factor [Acidovorax sp. GBBC 3299]WCM76616.1 sigma-70 family RNA polymerase sigma factor [Acidovorax sp. GBBC 712]